MIDNIISGLLGSLVGALATYGAIRLQMAGSAKERLRILLLLNGHAIYYAVGEKESFYTDTIAANIAEAHGLYLTVRNGTFCCNRSNLDAAWGKYCGADFRNEIPKNEPAHLFQRGPHTKQSAQDAITNFVAALNHG